MSDIISLVQAAKALSAKLHEAIPHLDSVCSVSGIHGCEYSGPQFGEELRELDTALNKPLAYLEAIAVETRNLVKPDQRKVVCAACKWEGNIVVLGVRHFSPDMRLTVARMGLNPIECIEQGFVDQWGNWLTRQEAYDIALRQGQYHPWEPYAPGTLFSEDLY